MGTTEDALPYLVWTCIFRRLECMKSWKVYVTLHNAMLCHAMPCHVHHLYGSWKETGNGWNWKWNHGNQEID